MEPKEKAIDLVKRFGALAVEVAKECRRAADSTEKIYWCDVEFQIIIQINNKTNEKSKLPPR